MSKTKHGVLARARYLQYNLVKTKEKNGICKIELRA